MGSKRVQTSNKPSILERRFRPYRQTPKKITSDPKRLVHPAIVIADLRRGVLTSLDWYLRTSRGMLNRSVAVELRKLIGGSPARSKFRIISIDHPDGPAPMKGRPQGSKRVGPSDRQVELANALRLEVARQPKIESAATEVAKAFKVTARTVFRAAAAVRSQERRLLAAEANRREVNERIDRALANLRADREST